MRNLIREMPYAGLVAICFSLIGYYFFTGLYCSDDTRYLIGAIKIALGEPISVTSLAERRVMFLLPGAMMYAPGVDLELLVVPYTLFFVGLGAVGYFLARRVLSRMAAVAAMALAGTQPVFFLYAGAMLPDLASTLFLMLGLLFLCCWLEAVAAKPGDSRRSAWFAFGLGASIATAFTLKESGLVLLPVPLAVMALMGLRRNLAASLRDGIALAIGFAAVLAIEALVFRIAAGQWHSSVASLLVPHDVAGFIETQGRSPIARLRTLRYLLGPHTSALFALAAVASLRLAFIWYQRRLPGHMGLAWLAVVGFWAWPLFYFTFGTASLSSYLLPVMQQRYYAPSIVPAAILVVNLMVSVVHLARAGAAARLSMAVSATVAIWLASAPYLDRGERGLIYAAAAKEAFTQAREDARQRYPGIPLYDVASGWTTDLNRCRALLMPVYPDGENRLMQAIRSGDDVRGRFGYRQLDDMSPPFLVAGHGAFMEARKPSRWVASLRVQVEEGRMQATRVGRYGQVPRRALRGLSWLPRTVAAARASGISPAGERADAPTPAEPNEVEMYLISPGRL